MTAKVLINILFITLVINLITTLNINSKIEKINKGFIAKEAVTVPSGLPENLEVIY